MAKSLALTAALLVALVALAGATTFTTTVTTTTLDEEANQRQRQCSQQVQGRQFRGCQSFLRQRGGGGGYEEEDSVLEISTENPRQQQSLQQCCNELRQVDEQCQCEAVRQAVRQVQQGGYGGGQSEQIYQTARSLPRMCGLRSQQCQFHLVLV